MNKQKYFPLNLSVKSVDEENFTVDAIVTNQSLDSDKEIVLNSAWKTFDRYKGNPVLMANHDIYDMNNIIGKCLSINKVKDQVECKFQYFVGEGNEKADWAYIIAKKKMAAFSVGFLVHDIVFSSDEIDKTIKEEKLKIEKDKRVNAIIKNAELYEVSQVAVGSNKEALMKSKSFHKVENFDSIYKEIQNEIEEIYKKAKEKEDKKVKSVVPFHSYPLATEGEEWDADKEVAKIRTWAGYDGEDKNTVDWEKYSRAFTWVVTEDIENFSSYKFPHHSIEDGDIKTHRRGVIAAMQRLLGSSTMPEENKENIYSHLAKHYTEDMEMTPPEFKTNSEDNDKDAKKDEDKKGMINMKINLNEIVEISVNEAIKGLKEQSNIEFTKYLDENSKKIDNILEKVKIIDGIEEKIDKINNKFVKIKEKEKDDKELYSDLLDCVDKFEI